MQHLATGSYGTVSVDKNGWAVKLFDEECQEAALREVVISQLVQAQHVIPVHEVCYTPDCKSISMELALGSLHDMIVSDSSGGIAQYGTQWCDIVIQSLMGAIGHIHKLGVMHRDIKPDNVMIMRDGTVRLCDFSLAKFDGEARCHTPRCGTADYMAPEIEGCAYTQAVDLYSCGITVMEIVTGHVGIEQGLHASVLGAVRAYRPGWADIIANMMCRDPNKRKRCTAPSVQAHVAGTKIARHHLEHNRIVSLLDRLDIDDRYHDHISGVVHTYYTVIPAATMLELVVIAACVVFGHTNDTLDACALVMNNHVIAITNTIRAHSPTLLYECQLQKGDYKQRARKPETDLAFSHTCDLHACPDDSDSDSDSCSSDSEMETDTPQSQAAWLTKVRNTPAVERAEPALLHMRAAVAEIIRTG